MKLATFIADGEERLGVVDTGRDRVLDPRAPHPGGEPRAVGERDPQVLGDDDLWAFGLLHVGAPVALPLRRGSRRIGSQARGAHQRPAWRHWMQAGKHLLRRQGSRAGAAAAGAGGKRTRQGQRRDMHQLTVPGWRRAMRM